MVADQIWTPHGLFRAGLWTVDLPARKCRNQDEYEERQCEAESRFPRTLLVLV